MIGTIVAVAIGAVAAIELADRVAAAAIADAMANNRQTKPAPRPDPPILQIPRPRRQFEPLPITYDPKRQRYVGLGGLIEIPEEVVAARLV